MSVNKNIVLMGPPGGGKGTQAVRLAAELNMKHLATGDLLRAAVAQKSDLGLKVKDILESGGLVSDDIIIALIAEQLDKMGSEQGIILDGFPRTVPQAQALDEMFKNKNNNIDYAIEIEVPDEKIIERITGRFACAKCGKGYHDKFMKPLKEGFCDVCGGNEFSRRKDDNKETVKERLAQYKQMTAPIIPYYQKQGKLVNINGDDEPNTVYQKIVNILLK